MCLIAIGVRAHPRYRLVMVANRDEWFRRPASPLHFWPDHPDVLAGRDLDQGGTWLGVARSGRLAAITNYRDPGSVRSGAPSRGRLVSDFLTGAADASGYLDSVQDTSAIYNGFNLLAGDAERLFVLSNRAGRLGALGPGIYGLSNHLLDTPWPKVREAKARLAAALASDPSIEDLALLLDDTRVAPDTALPDTGVGLEWERALSPMRIVAGDYGTRCTTAITISEEGAVEVLERSYGADGALTGVARERFSLAAG